MSLVKSVERLGRRLLVGVLELLLGVKRRPVQLPANPRVLVVRLDERVGNLLLLTPLLETVRARFPGARIDLLGNARNQVLMQVHPAIERFLPFRKKALLAADGPLRAPWRLRREAYDLAIDAANPTDPSTTQVILTRLCGARHTIGADHPGFGRLFSAPVSIAQAGPHEIDLRLALAQPLPGTERVCMPSLPRPTHAPSQALEQLLADLPEGYAVINIGARLANKRLDAAAYASLGDRTSEAGFLPVFAWGPSEHALASQAYEQCEAGRLAPPTTLIDLAHLMAGARVVITCDTGPMHLAVALGTPTCGLFVSTDPERYGYPELPHTVVDVRKGFGEDALVKVEGWLGPLASGL